MNTISPSQPESKKSRFCAMMRNLRASLINETDCLYFLHTSQGEINISRYNHFTQGFIAISGEDEHKAYRFIIVSEEEICSFPLEVKRKTLQGTKETLGFKPTLGGEHQKKA